MDCRLRPGIVPSASTLLPRLIDLKPGFIDPTKIKLEDGFARAGRAALVGTAPDYANNGQVWGTNGTWTVTPSDVAATGSIAGNVLTVSAVASGVIAVGMAVTGAGVSGETIITALGTGTGGTGTYTVNIPQQAVSTALVITEGGYATGVNVFGFMDLGFSDAKLMARIKCGAASTSFASLIARYVDGSNFIRANLSFSLGQVFVQKNIAGVTTNLATPSMAFTLGQTYLLTVKIVGNVFTIYVDHQLVATFTEAALAGNNKVGISCGNALHKIKYFAAGAV